LLHVLDQLIPIEKSGASGNSRTNEQLDFAIPEAGNKVARKSGHPTNPPDPVTSTCIRDQNDSIMEMSKQSAMLPIDGSSPEALARSVKAQEPPCDPRSECTTTTPLGRRRATAVRSAMTASCAVIRSSSGVAHDPVAEQVLDRAAVDLALGGGVLGDVGDPH
jgi:hypothetical protein